MEGPYRFNGSKSFGVSAVSKSRLDTSVLLNAFAGLAIFSALAALAGTFLVADMVAKAFLVGGAFAILLGALLLFGITMLLRRGQRAPKTAVPGVAHHATG